MTAYEQVLQELHRAPPASFVVERKRLAAELRARGDEEGAMQLAKRPKPAGSVWVVNQLYWQSRESFDAMLAAAARLRQGDRGANKLYQEAIAKLRAQGAVILQNAGLASSEATLRRAATTLAAIGAAGGFAPDPPGALGADRDPPGFEMLSVPSSSAAVDPQSATASPPAAEDADRARLRAEELERKRREVERARQQAERARLRAALSAATAELRSREEALSGLEKQLHDAGQAVSETRATVEDLERQLQALDLED